MESCCTCATILTPTLLYHDEKPLPANRRLGCCARVICGNCIHNNRRFTEYCPYCQVSSVPSTLPQGLRNPPLHTPLQLPQSKTTDLAEVPPPPYTAVYTLSTPKDPNDEKAALTAEQDLEEDTLHFLDHDHDTIMSLSLRYSVPAEALRKKNNLASDQLLLGRKTVLIPGEFYKDGVSLSPRPIEGEEEELRKGKIRRFMTSCKVSAYDVALLYLEQSGYDLDDAIQSYFGDEAWVRQNPLEKRKDKLKQKSRAPFWRG